VLVTTVAASSLGLALGLALGDLDSLSLGEPDSLSDGDAEGDLDGLTLGELDGLVEGETLAEGLSDGEILGDALGLLLGLMLGEPDGLLDGDAEGDREGDIEGDLLSDSLGLGESAMLSSCSYFYSYSIWWELLVGKKASRHRQENLLGEALLPVRPQASPLLLRHFPQLREAFHPLRSGSQ